MTLLVVASPCALVLSIPSAVLAAIAWGARHGILFRGGAAVEKLADVNVVALDKTGTLTTGELRVEKVESFPPGRESEIAQLAYSLERLSTHPLARAITRYGKQQRLAADRIRSISSPSPARACERVRNGDECSAGPARMAWRSVAIAAAIDARSPPTEAGLLRSLAGAKATCSAASFCAMTSARRRARWWMNCAAKACARVVLTGDRKATAEHLRDELQLDDVRAELKPEEKVAAIRALSEQGKRVAMVGDGVNDAPSLAAAHVGVAMGARGSDAALEQADVVLMHDRLENFLAAFRLSQRARRIIRQNLVISLGTVVVLVASRCSGKSRSPLASSATKAARWSW